MLHTLKRAVLRNVKGQASRGFATSSNQADTLSKYPIGLNYYGFSIEQVQPIPEFSLVAVKLKHNKTGSEHLHLDAPHDRNNVFLVAFKTNPPDATGVPHILEHTTLCGSYKYPVRDPFFKMLNRSLSNFMNAMTGHDYTFYPFATTNAKDFENLMDVYLSSVFEPLLTYEDFAQEGWRLENENVDDKSSPINFKGVVYNEMKGQYSSSAYYHWIKFQEAMYSSLNNSGGDPHDITDLTYENLVDYHTSYYHPSNSKTFTYGSLPLINHLKKLNETYEVFGKRSVNNSVKSSLFEDLKNNNKNFDSAVVKGPIDTMSNKAIEEQYKSSITWYLGNPLDESSQYDIFKWKILSSLTCDGHSAPFYQEFIEKEYSDDFTINSGLDSTTSLLSFTMGLNNLTKEKVENLDNKINEVLHEKILPEFANNSPVFQERIEAILHQIELSFKKHKPDFGLGLLSSVVPTWVNGLNPLTTLQVERIIQRFKDEFNDKGLKMFEELLLETLLNENTPRFKFTIEPDENFSKDIAKDEQQRLSNKVQGLNEDDKQVIFDRSQKLLEKQQQEGDVSILPTLELHDIPRKGDSYGLEFSSVNSKKLQKRIVDSNGLIYAAAAKDLSYLPSEYYEFMPLFLSCLTNLAGTTKTSTIDLETKIQKLTGGVSFSLSNKTDPYNIGKTNLKLVALGMALESKSQSIYDLWFEILSMTRFSPEQDVVDKLYTLIRNLGQNQMNNIADRGHSFASSFSSSKLTVSKNIRNITSGLDQINFILKLNQKLDSEGRDYLIKEILPKLQDLQSILVKGTCDESNPGFSYSLIGGRESILDNEKMIQKFDDSIIGLGKNIHQDQLSNYTRQFDGKTMDIKENHLINLPFQVGYSSLGKLGSAYTTKDGASLQVLSQLLSFKHLHSVIREANGAYGGGLSFDGLGGTLNFYSYRDPNPGASIESFRKSGLVAVEKLSQSWDIKDLQEAKLAIFQSVDAPSPITYQGSSNFIEGITDEMRQERRERFLDVNKEDLQNVAEKYLLNGSKEIASVIGDSEALEIAEKETNWNIHSF